MSLEDARGSVAIQVKNVYKQYGRGPRAVKVLNGISMEVPFHGMYVILRFLTSLWRLYCSRWSINCAIF